jgi:DNA polymerase-3 subunit gamma/tau
MDVQEIDGASNTGVDDVRDLRESLRYHPAKGRFRVYIIDEVHMLSNAAFNALLKTLEEPPAHVVFIFATTEPHKIPMTILSRCQRFDFKRIPLIDIVHHLELIGREESIQVDRDTLILIGKEAQGSLRDAQSLLDQVISFAGQAVTTEATQEVLGLLDREWLFKTSLALIEKDARACLDVIDELFQRGHSLTYFYHQLIEHLRNLMVVRIDAGAVDLLHLPDHELKELDAQARQMTPEDLQLWFDILIHAEEEIRKSQYPKYLLEMLLVKMALLDRTHDLQDLLDRLGAVSGEITGGSKQEANTREEPELSYPAPETNRVSEISPRTWGAFLNHVRSSRPSLASVLEQGRFLESSEDETVRVAFPTSFHADRISDGEQRQMLQALTSEYFGNGVEIIPVVDEREAAGRNNQGKQNNHQLQVGVKSHPLVQETLQVFGGRIVEIRLEGPEESTRTDASTQGHEKEGDGEGTG